MTTWTPLISHRKTNENQTRRKEKVMKAKLIALVAVVLFALGCGDTWNPLAPPPPLVDPSDGSGPECHERLYTSNDAPPHCGSSSLEDQQ